MRPTAREFEMALEVRASKSSDEEFWLSSDEGKQVRVAQFCVGTDMQLGTLVLIPEARRPHRLHKRHRGVRNAKESSRGALRCIAMLLRQHYRVL
jgi:hypothetical protein